MHRTSLAPSDLVKLLTLRNSNGMEIHFSERGGSMVSWLAPDRYGKHADILLGWRNKQDYANNTCYFGSLVGRWANRIENAQFNLDGQHYTLHANEGNHQLHGGPDGFHQVLWEVKHHDDSTLVLHHYSKAGAGGFPGNVDVQVSYTLDNDGNLSIQYEASTDAPTPVNLTSHPYFNLSGGETDIGDHQLWIDADSYLATDDALIPVEQIQIAGTAFDFRHAAPIGPRLKWPDKHIAQTGGFDHCFCLSSQTTGTLRPVARVYDPSSGRELTVSTTESALQFYSGNGLGGVQGRNKQPYATYDGLCLEAQAWPNQVNGPNAEAVILRPGQTYRQTTVYRVGVQDIDALTIGQAK